MLSHTILYPFTCECLIYLCTHPLLATALYVDASRMAFQCLGFCLQGRTVQDLRKEVGELRAQMQAQLQAVAGMAAERDGCRAATAEASDSAQARASASALL